MEGAVFSASRAIWVAVMVHKGGFVISGPLFPSKVNKNGRRLCLLLVFLVRLFSNCYSACYKGYC
jgi:hypothetical protein